MTVVRLLAADPQTQWEGRVVLAAGAGRHQARRRNHHRRSPAVAIGDISKALLASRVTYWILNSSGFMLCSYSRAIP